MSGRADLLALSDDALAALANRGLVKRALREVAAGAGPALDEAADGTVTATWDDGTVTTVAPGESLEQGRCSCPAAGVCRHRVMLALAYRTHGSSEQRPSGPRDVGDVTDEQLEDHLGARTMAAARRALRAGCTARVRRPTQDDPVPTVELPSVTVRFLVGGELGYAHADAARGARPDAVALAVWAWRAAAEVDPAAAVVDVQVGGSPSSSSAEAVELALELTCDALTELLASGTSALDAAGERSLAGARRALDARNLRWPVGALDDLLAAVADYRSRSSAYSAVAAAGLVAELVARSRCAGRGASPPAAVLGTEEAARTPMRLARLTALGARLRGPEDRRTLEVYLAHPESATVLVVRRVFEPDEDGTVPDLDRIGRSAAAGHRMTALAAAEVVTESAVRAADRTVTIAASRVSRTTVAPSSGRWEALPPGLLLRDLDQAATALGTRPPAVVRPRVAAHDLRAVVVDDVQDVAWSPGEQQLVARVRAATGDLRLRCRHTAAAPGAVDALQTALRGELGRVRHVAGHLHREAAGLVLEPTAVVVGDRVLVPDLTAPRPSTPAPVPGAEDRRGSPARAAVEEALRTSAALVHAGWRYAPGSWPGRAARAADGLRRAGLTAAADALQALPGRVGAADPRQVLDAWADVHLRLLVTAEQL